MHNAEWAIVALNAIIILVAYLSVYPKLAGSDFNKIAGYDLLASGLALFIVGYKYWGSGHDFTLLFTEVNWFWFTFITYAIIEVPVMLWYFRKHRVDVDAPFRSGDNES